MTRGCGDQVLTEVRPRIHRRGRRPVLEAPPAHRAGDEVHNGTSPRSGGAQPGASLCWHSPLTTEGIIAAHRNVLSVLDDAREAGEEDIVLGMMAHPRWVPFAEDICGDIVFVDHREQHAGEIGLMSYGNPQYEPLWPSMDGMWQELYASVKDGSLLRPVSMQPFVEDGRILRWRVVLG